MERSPTCLQRPVRWGVGVAAMLLALAACSGSSGLQGDDAPVQPDLPGDPGNADLPDVPGDAALDTAPEAVADVAADACTPDCAGHSCGDDRCGGSCGACTAPHTTCDPVQGKCVTTCDWATEKPAAWGPAGHVSALQTLADATVVKATCFDYTGDGIGDNGFKAMAGQFNGPLFDAIGNGSLVLLFELAGVTDFDNTASFQLNGLLGASTTTPPATTGDFQVQEASYITGNCQPRYLLGGASIMARALAAGPSELHLSIPIEADLIFDASLIQVKAKGTLNPGAGADGVEMTDGVLSGVLTQQQWDSAIARLQAACDAAPAAAKPSFCSYLNAQPDFSWYDLHVNGDGTFSAKTKDLPGDALSVCFSFTLSKARVVGFAP